MRGRLYFSSVYPAGPITAEQQYDKSDSVPVLSLSFKKVAESASLLECSLLGHFISVSSYRTETFKTRRRP